MRNKHQTLHFSFPPYSAIFILFHHPNYFDNLSKSLWKNLFGIKRMSVVKLMLNHQLYFILSPRLHSERRTISFKQKGYFGAIRKLTVQQLLMLDGSVPIHALFHDKQYQTQQLPRPSLVSITIGPCLQRTQVYISFSDVQYGVIIQNPWWPALRD